MFQQLGNATNAECSKILDDRFSGQGGTSIRTGIHLERASDRQLARRQNIQLRDRCPEVGEIIHRQRFGRFRVSDCRRKNRRSRLQLVRADEHVVSALGAWRPVAFPIRSIAPLRHTARRDWIGVGPDHRRFVVAADRDDDVLDGGRALRIRDGDGVSEDQRLAVGNEVRQIDLKVRQRPLDRPGAGSGAVLAAIRRDAGSQRRRKFIDHALAGRIRKGLAIQQRARHLDGDRVGIGEIWIGEVQRALGRGVRNQLAAFGIRAGRDEADVLLRAGNDRRVVGAGDRDRDRLRSGLVERLIIIIDGCRVGQRQRLAGSEEVKGLVGDAIVPGGAPEPASVGTGIPGHGDGSFDFRNVRKLQAGQRTSDIVPLGILVGEGRELHRHRVMISHVDVVVLDLARYLIDRRAVGDVGQFCDSAGVSRVDLRRKRKMIGGRGSSCGPRGPRRRRRRRGKRRQIAVDERKIDRSERIRDDRNR